MPAAEVFTFEKKSSRPSASTQPTAVLYQARRAMLAQRFDEAAERLAPLSTDAHHAIEVANLLGVIHLCQQRPDDARAQFEAVLTRQPENVCALVYRGELAAAAGDEASAARDWRQAVSCGHPDEALVRRALELLGRTRSGSTHR